MAQVGYQHVGLAELYLDQALELEGTELFCMFSKFPFREITIAIIECRTVCPTQRRTAKVDLCQSGLIKVTWNRII